MCDFVAFDNAASLCVRVRARLLRTCHIHRAVLLRSTPDAQLTVDVVAPALDPSPGHDRTRVKITRGDGDGGYA